MKATGMVRRVDELGRIVIPKEIRKTLKIKEGEPLEIYVEKDNLLLKKYSKVGANTEIAENIANALTETTEKSVIVTDTECVIASSGKLKGLTGEKISNDAYKIISQQKSFAVNVEEGINLYQLTTGEEKGFSNQVILPIIGKDGGGLGLIALYGDKSGEQINANTISLLRLATNILACGE